MKGCRPLQRPEPDAEDDRDPTITFGAFARRWRPVLLACAREVGADSDLAEDVAQAVLLKLWTGGAWKEIESPLTYLRLAARREALRALEAERRSEPLSTIEHRARSPARGPWAVLVRREQKATLEACIRRLPQRCGLVMTLKLMEGLTHPEIASRLRISRGAVDKQVARGKEHLRRVLRIGPTGGLEWVSSFEDGGG